MDTMIAFAMGEANRHKEQRVFDWVKAAKIIKERKPDRVEAGLAGDWEYTGGSIYEDGKPVREDDTYVYLASTWARPEIDVDGVIEDCWLMESDAPGWDAKTYWPPEALAILEGPDQ